MPLGQGIAQVLGAIPSRIEVAGHGPTWRITGDSFESVLDYAQERFDDFAVLDVARRDRWWTRITLTVTTDPEQAVGAPTLEELRDRLAGPVTAEHDPSPDAGLGAAEDPDADNGESQGPFVGSAGPAAADEEPPAEDRDPSPLSTLEAIFADQSGPSRDRARLPRQRRGASHRGSD